MALEESAIKAILSIETELCRTPAQNPGYDLYEQDADDNIVKWVEVKAMVGAFSDRPIAMSHTQFEAAVRLQESFWLYVVEHASEPQKLRIVRIQNPAGNAKSFTLDSGWESIAMGTNSEAPDDS